MKINFVPESATTIKSGVYKKRTKSLAKKKLKFVFVVKFTVTIMFLKVMMKWKR